MPTHALCHAIELYTHHQTESFLRDMEKQCEKHPPFSILLQLKLQLDRPDSIYYKYLELANFNSDPANMFMKEFEGIVIELMLFHGVCQSFFHNNTDYSTDHIRNETETILTLIQKQRKEVPNLLTSEIIIRHLSGIRMTKCYEEIAVPSLQIYEPVIDCPENAVVSFLYHFITFSKIT